MAHTATTAAPVRNLQHISFLPMSPPSSSSRVCALTFASLLQKGLLFPQQKMQAPPPPPRYPSSHHKYLHAESQPAQHVSGKNIQSSFAGPLFVPGAARVALGRPHFQHHHPPSNSTPLHVAPTAESALAQGAEGSGTRSTESPAQPPAC